MSFCSLPWHQRKSLTMSSSAARAQKSASLQTHCRGLLSSTHDRAASLSAWQIRAPGSVDSMVSNNRPVGAHFPS
nr:hypothetical protein CFP56_62208 [Quercus suber]